MSKPSNVYTVVTIYAIGISVVCGRQIAKWNKANKNRRRVKVASGSGRENGKPSSKLLRIWTGALGFTSKVSSHKGSGRSSISTMSALAPKVVHRGPLGDKF
eukprot:gene6896-7623_t